MNRFLSILMWGLYLFFFSQVSFALPPGELKKTNDPHTLMIIDNGTYIHSNYIFMFVTNHGNFGRDLGGVFGYDYGTYYPYRSLEEITNASPPKSPLYAAGIWIGGKVNGEIRLALSEYDSEYVPGPMDNGTFQEDRWDFKVYKLHSDSLEDNPNQDYNYWPTNQGAPVNLNGEPVMLGDQLLWTTYNDADPSRRGDVDGGETAPLGVEIHQQVWSTYQEGNDISINSTDIPVTQMGSSPIMATAKIVNLNELTGHAYKIIVDTIPDWGSVWHLINLTTGEILLENQTNFFGSYSPLVEGFRVKVEGLIAGFSEFTVVANAYGPIDPPEAGAASFQGFPVPLDYSGIPLRPTDNQQAGEGRWFFHTADNGGTSGGGTRGSFEEFVNRVTRGGNNMGRIGNYDYDMRFTGDNSNPGIGGSYASEAFYDENVIWVPFELWRTGIETPNDPSDDVRLLPLIIDDAGLDWEGDNIFALESYGIEGTTCSGDCEHSVSGLDDDPFTDWVYWYEPTDLTPGESGYEAFKNAILDNPNVVWDIVGDEVIARTVLVNWNGGEAPPFNQDVPEQGTIFRLTTFKEEPPIDSFVFVTEPEINEDVGYDASAIFVQYKIFNKSQNAIEDCYISVWVDSDIGSSTDDLVGCDTIDNLFYTYNDEDDDTYGFSPPATGFKILAGPLVPSPGSQAVFDGKKIDNYMNLGMSSFQKYINGTDPDNFAETYNYMQGLDKLGDPYMYDGQVVKYMHSGDPVAGTGDLDSNPDDRRMMANFGPITMLPNDSQYVLLKMAVGQGMNAIHSVEVTKEILNSGYQLLLTGDVNGDAKLNVGDAVFIINRVFRNGVAPNNNLNNNDVNCDGKLNVGDAVYLINLIFRGGPFPDCP